MKSLHASCENHAFHCWKFCKLALCWDLFDMLADVMLYFGENYLFGTEINQSSVFGTRKFELFYLAPS
jgi:hypothetical protein